MWIKQVFPVEPPHACCPPIYTTNEVDSIWECDDCFKWWVIVPGKYTNAYTGAKTFQLVDTNVSNV